MASAVSGSQDGVISKQLLKSKSGEFDLQSIHHICLANTGISDLGCVGDCTSLQCLDLSCNYICRLHKLAAIISMTRLNLSANKIISLEGLQSLENLECLNICGNLLASAAALRPLVGLTKLTTLRLHDQLTGLTNPMCGPSYVDEVQHFMPALVTLDGQRIHGKGSELYQLCRDMDETITNMSRNQPTDRYENDHMTNKVTFPWAAPRELRGQRLQAEGQLKDMLVACKELTWQARLALPQV